MAEGFRVGSCCQGLVRFERCLFVPVDSGSEFGKHWDSRCQVAGQRVDVGCRNPEHGIREHLRHLTPNSKQSKPWLPVGAIFNMATLKSLLGFSNFSIRKL